MSITHQSLYSRLLSLRLDPTGATVEEAEKSIREAIEFHLDGMREDGTPIPPPTSHVEYVEVAA